MINLVLCLVLYASVAAVKSAEPSDSSNGLLDIDLKALIQQPTLHQPQIFDSALRIIDTLASAPSCNRLATVNLIESCRSLEASDHDSPTIALDQVKSIFAARLAVCELTGAHATVPQQCLAMVPIQRVQDNKGLKCVLPGSHCNKKGGRTSAYAKVKDDQVHHCLNALESRPQWWISYSNARQNAVLMCHAARHEVEKDEMLNAHRSMTAVTSDASQALSETILQSRDQLNQLKAFNEAVLRMQADLLKEMGAGYLKAQGAISRILQQAEEGIQALLSRVLRNVEEATSNLRTLSKARPICDSRVQPLMSIQGIKQSAHEVETVREGIQDVLIDATRSSTQLTDRNKENWAANHELALALQHSLQASRERELEIAASFVGYRNEMRASAELMALMHQGQKVFLERATRLDQIYLELESRARSYMQVQKQQEAIQEQLHGNLHTQLRTTQDIVNKVSTTVSELDHRVDDAAKRFGALNLLGGFNGIFKWWPILVVGVALATLHKRTAALFTIAMVILWTLLELELANYVKVYVKWSTAFVAENPVGLQSLFGVLASFCLSPWLAWRYRSILDRFLGYRTSRNGTLC